MRSTLVALSCLALALLAVVLILWSGGAGDPAPSGPESGGVEAPVDPGSVQTGTVRTVGEGGVEAEEAAAADDDGAVARQVVEGAAADGWILRGLVTTVGEGAFAGARVRIERQVGSEAGARREDPIELLADDEGRFSWAFDPPDQPTTFRFSEDEPDHFTFGSSVEVLPGEPPPEPVELQLYAYDVEVRGRVLSLRESAPIPGAWASLHGALSECDAQGRFSLRSSGRIGGLYLQAGAPGHAGTRQVLDAPVEGVVEVELGLRPGRSLAVRVVDEASRPVEGATVDVFYRRGDEPETGSDGRVVFDDLDPDRESHSVRAVLAGYVEASAQVELADWPDELEMVLVRGTRVHGFLRDDQGAGVAFAKLFIGHGRHAWNRIDARADASGHYEFAAVGEGAQSLWIEAEGFAPAQQQIEVPSDRPVLQVDVTMERGRTVRGVVVDAEGVPRPGVSVSPKARASSDPRGMWNYIGTRTASDAEGEFVLEGLPNQDIQLELYGRDIVRAEQLVDVETSSVRLVVEPAARIAGQVVDAATGQPIPAFRIRIVESERGGYSATWVREGRSFQSKEGVWDSQGEEFPVGSVWGVQAAADGYAPLRASGLVAELDPDPEAHVLRLTRGGTVTGQLVRSTGGEPVADAQVLVFEDAESLSRFRDEPYGAIADRTSADGRFQLRNVPGGAVRLAVLPPGGQAPVFDGPFELAELGRAERSIRIGRGARLVGRFVGLAGEAVSGAKISLMQTGGVGGGAGGQSDSRSVQTDAEGSFRFEGLGAGAYRLSALAVDAQGESCCAVTQCEVASDDEREVVLRPEGRGTVRGSVTGATPVPDGTRVTLFQSEGGAARLPLQAEVRGGRFVLRGVPAGHYQITVLLFRGGVRSGVAEADVPEGGEVEVGLTLRESKR